MAVQDFMSKRVVTVELDNSLDAVRELLANRQIHHVVVVDHGRVRGVISDRDVLLNLSPFVGKPLGERTQDTATLHLRVHQFMTRHPITIAPTAELQDAAELMLTYGISCLPVISADERLLGIVTVRDLLRAAYSPNHPAAV